MKKKLKIILPFLILCAVFIPIYLEIYVFYPNEPVKSFTVNKKILDISGETQKEAIYGFKKKYGNNYKYIKSYKDGSIEFGLTEAQRKSIIKQIEKTIKRQQKDIKNESSKYEIYISYDYQEVNVYCDKYCFDLDPILRNAEINCAYYQIFNGKEDWSVTLSGA